MDFLYASLCQKGLPSSEATAILAAAKQNAEAYRKTRLAEILGEGAREPAIPCDVCGRIGYFPVCGSCMDAALDEEARMPA